MKPLLQVFLGCASLLAAVPTQAQYVDRFDDLLPPRAVVARLSDRGFTEIDRPRFDGRAYVVDATNPYGDRIRLFIDAEDGAVLGRRRLSAPPIRVSRPAPGFGWTEEDVERRHPLREAERIVPPANIPSVPPLARAPHGEPIDRNPSGLNPEAARPRTETPKKVVRLNPPAKPTSPRITPDAPKAATPAPAKPEPPTAAIEPPKAAPAAPQPAESKPAEVPKTDGMVSDAQPAQAWKDPPAEAKRPVRVIDGATVVPGTVEKGATE